MTIPIANPCIPCGLTRPTCCNALNGTAYEILMTYEEVEHAARSIGKTFDDVATWRPRTEVEMFSMMRRKDDRKQVPSLRVRADGSCYFLESCGCILRAEDKPRACRVFPFKYDDTEWRITPPARGCYAAEQGRDVPGTMEQFGVTPETLEALR